MTKVTRIVSVVLLTVGAAGLSSAGILVGPEIDPGTGMNALALLAGALLVIRSGRKK